MVAHGTSRGERVKTTKAPSRGGRNGTSTRCSFAATRLWSPSAETHGLRRGLPSYAAPQLSSRDHKLICAPAASKSRLVEQGVVVLPGIELSAFEVALLGGGYWWGNAPAEPPPMRSADMAVGVIRDGTDWPTRMSALHIGGGSAGVSSPRRTSGRRSGSVSLDIAHAARNADRMERRLTTGFRHGAAAKPTLSRRSAGRLRHIRVSGRRRRRRSGRAGCGLRAIGAAPVRGRGSLPTWSFRRWAPSVRARCNPSRSDGGKRSEG